ncbi:hypothetical protein F2P56_023227 [Juglans regia]|uniref:Ubiquitin-like domain-containing protein n=1 Tax=Juglans regia TaxID=51240 RepID=A0A833UML0_JUGRE|nr:hypothetical protein F2P56_023227 [Juglans regia]
MAKLKIGGTWAGVIEVVLEEWTVPMLRIEVAKRSNCGPESINLICAGKVLRDGDGTEKLAQLGVKNNARILASRGSIEEGKSLEEGLLAEEERSRRLSRVKAAATALAKRHADGSLPVEDFNIEVEDQSGQIVQLGSETDQRAVMMGLMLHANGKQLIRSENYKDALEVLTMGEEAFSLCNPKVIEVSEHSFTCVYKASCNSIKLLMTIHFERHVMFQGHLFSFEIAEICFELLPIKGHHLAELLAERAFQNC